MSRFLGQEWSKSQFWVYICWLVALTAPLIGVLFVIKPYWPSRSVITAIVIALVISSLATLICGYFIGRYRSWKHSMAIIVSGTIGVMFCYAIAMIVSNPNDPTADNDAGAGLAIFTIPVAGILSILLGIGAGIGMAVNKLTSK